MGPRVEQPVLIRTGVGRETGGLGAAGAGFAARCSALGLYLRLCFMLDFRLLVLFCFLLHVRALYQTLFQV